MISRGWIGCRIRSACGTKSSSPARTAMGTTMDLVRRGCKANRGGHRRADARSTAVGNRRAAICERTVAVAFSVGFSPLDLRDVVAVARRHGLPVIVDASAALPPRSNLRAFLEAGADLVGFSGGKAIRGPQASGILCGRRELIASAALQMWDLDFLPELWNPPNH